MAQSKGKIIVTFGCLSGLVSAGLMFATVPFIESIGFERGAVVGYTAMVISFLFVFFGVRRYRDSLDGGRLTFGKAFGVGLLITLISTAFYVVAWEIVYYNFMPDFADQYAAYILEKARASGASEAVVAAKAKELADYKAIYANPFISAAITFIEPLPVGLLVSLVSAVALRSKR